jgi:hypothetical protein
VKDDRQSRRRKRGLVACVALAALVLPAPAVADDGFPAMPDPAAAVDAALASQPDLSASETSAPVSAEDVAAAVDQAVQQTVQQAVDEALSSPDAAQPAPPQAPVIHPDEAQNSPDSAVSPVVSTDSTPLEPAVADAAPESAPIDPAPAPREAAAAPQDAAAPASEQDPAIDAAAPTAEITALAEAPLESPAPATTTSAGQYQNGNQPDTNTVQSGASEAAQPSADISADQASNPPSTWIWNWSWNCVDNPSEPRAPPQGATGWIWNWTWDCPTVSPSGTPAAGSSDSGSSPCSTCNTAISIRILSPGNDGDVIQANQTTSASIAQNISTTIQTVEQSVQQTVNQLPLVQPVPLPPAAPAPGGSGSGIVIGGGSFGGIAVAPWPTPVLQIPYIVQPAPWPTAAAPILEALAPFVDAEPIISGIAAVSILFDGPVNGATALKPHVNHGGISAVPDRSERTRHPASVVFATTPPASPARAWPAAAPSATTPAASHPAGAGTSRKIPKPGSPWQPPPPAPPGSEHGLSTGAAASGSSSSLGGFALFLAALLVIVPPALPTLLAVGARRPRGTAGRPPERPG